MHADSPPTESPAAAQAFQEGETLFRRYLQGAAGGELRCAEEALAAAEQYDPRFRRATFLHAVVLNELREADRAIGKLEALTTGGGDLVPEVYAQLAYAHVKRYSKDSYRLADKALDQAAATAPEERRFRFLIDAYRCYLYAVRGGRGEREARAGNLNRAIRLGQSLLREGKASGRIGGFVDIEAEAHNALGIAYMRMGEEVEAVDDAHQYWWKQAEAEFDAGLSHGWAVARLLQNFGTLRRIQGDHEQRLERSAKAGERYQEAIDLYLRSRQINPWDGFTVYRLAELRAKQGHWQAARGLSREGRTLKSSVRESAWDRLGAAVQEEDPRLLSALRDSYGAGLS